MFGRNWMGLVFVALVLCGSAWAQEPIVVGAGDQYANLVVNFKDGADYWFEVAFEDGQTAADLWLLLDAETELVLEYSLFGSDVFVDGITYDGHSNVGYQGGEDWWHEWVRASEQEPWAWGNGISGHVMAPGRWDALVYGTAGEPTVPEPATILLLASAGGALLVRRRS